MKKIVITWEKIEGFAPVTYHWRNKEEVEAFVAFAKECGAVSVEVRG